ncbi:LacI family DNA-binding transcriptional regulator [Actinomadura fibrosa]|uniref:LacI family DNA-binding transcriptional regulator n=1 Tax=Actinomadura fibrosa TaxID=111802 RepID=A0ABW2XJF7_9ACTN|nr:LacI family DNA-binding transcriptional regulator [Actinomadura fibrosa]
MKPPTIYDVAKHAGVSHQTVTRYLKGFQGIRPETRQRVEAALAALDYRPNSAARLLRSQRTNRIGVLADRIDQSGPARILTGAGELAHLRGYVLDVVVADGTSAGSVAASLATIIEHQVAGILATAQTDVVLEELRRQATATPLVIDVEPGGEADRPAVNELAGRCAADHLLDLGHRDIGYLAGPEVWIAARGRTSGFTRRVAERGGRVVWVRQGDWSAASGHAVWSALEDAERAVTAVGVANDSMAIGLISAAADSGVRVPDDLSVVGTDDLPEARYVLPALSTVAMDFEAEGRFLIEKLLARIEGTAVPEDALPAAPHLIARTSTTRLVIGT